MPTPRFTTQVAAQAGRSASGRGGGSNAGNWVSGTIASVIGGINSTYQIYLDSGEYVTASSTIGEPIAEGDLVWVTRGGGITPIIVGLQ